jgi:hypothetical protein
MTSKVKSSSAEALADANYIAKVEGGIDKDISDLEYDGDFVVNCVACDKELFTIVKVSDRPTKIPMGRNQEPILVEKQRFKCNCPFCGGESWLVSVSGQVMVGHVEGVTSLANVSMGDPSDPNGMLTEVEVQK